MPYFTRKGLGATILSCACWTSAVVLGAEEQELPRPAAEAAQYAPLVDETPAAESKPSPLNGERPLPTVLPAPSNVVTKKRQTGQFMFGVGANSNAGLPADDQPAADRNEPMIETAPGLFEANPEVLEFARKLNEQLQAAETRKPSKLRSGWSGGLRPDACPSNCPICGTPVKPAEDFTIGAGPGAPARKPTANWLFQEVDVENLQGDRSRDAEDKLSPGEPAQVILDLRERLGASALEGSEFTVKPDALAKLIRALDREARQQETLSQLEPESWTPPTPSWSAAAAPSSPADEATISALRAASRQLDEAAELLEQQNLFERADELREQADRLRRDARGFLQERCVPPPTSPALQQTSVPALIEQPLVQATALMAPAEAEFTKSLPSSRRKPKRSEPRTFNFFMGSAR
ncbi:MAG TPA: hypothetical protein VGN42_24945 [Pirellulales bacterium]|nr:hypothetical protein [Pirellulales bacterium]